MSFFSRLFGKDEEGEPDEEREKAEAEAQAQPEQPPAPPEKRPSAKPARAPAPAPATPGGAARPAGAPASAAKPPLPPGAKRTAATLKQGSGPGPVPPPKQPRRYNPTLRMFGPSPDGSSPPSGEEGALAFSTAPPLSDLIGTPPAQQGDAVKTASGRYSYANPNGGRKKAGRSMPPGADVAPPTKPSKAEPPSASPSAESHELLTLPEPLADPTPPPPKPKTRSKRPPRRASSGTTAAVDAAFDTMLTDLDTGFDSIQRKEDEAFAEGVEDMRDSADVLMLFEQIAANYVRPVRDFMMEMEWGKPRKEWIAVCVPAIKLLRRSADTISIPDLCKALDAFLETLDRCGSQTVTGELSAAARNELAASYRELTKLMPAAFAVDTERSQREPIIVQALLAQALGPDTVALEKVYAAGLTTLDVLLLAKPEDIVQTTGLPLDSAQQIVSRFESYRRESDAVVPDAQRTAEHRKLAELVAELRFLNDEFDRASAGWTDAAREQKKRLRQARTDTLLQINVVLARLGEVDRAIKLEKQPFNQKIRELDGYLEEAKRRGVSLG